KRFHHLVVAGVLDEDGGRHVCTAPGIDAGAAVDPTVIEDHHTHRQVVTADRFDLHARKTKGTIAFDCQHGVASLHGRRNGHAHATPITPQVPTSRRLRGLYISMMLRAKSSVLAPSFTRIASGRSLMIVRSAPSAPW